MANASELMHKAYDAYRARDLETTMDSFAPDALYVHYPPDSGVPFAGEFRGRDAIQARLVGLAERFEYLGLTVMDVIGEEEKAAARVSFDLRNRVTGETRTIDAAHFATFENGKVTEFHEYVDSMLVLKVAAIPDADA